MFMVQVITSIYKNAMVIPSLMARIHNGEKPLKVWGDGSAIRDFAYSTDVAIGVIKALYYGTDGGYVNLGSGKGITIAELLIAMQSFIDFEYEFDTTKSSGFPKRVMDIKKAKNLIKYDPQVDLKTGLKNTWEWYLKNSDEHLKEKLF